MLSGKGDHFDEELTKSIDNAIALADKERSNLLLHWINQPGAEISLAWLSHNTIILQLIRVFYQACIEPLFFLPITIPSRLVYGIFFSLLSFLENDSSYREGCVCLDELDTIIRFLAQTEGHFSHMDRLGGTLSHVRRLYLKAQEERKVSTILTTKSDKRAVPTFPLILMLVMLAHTRFGKSVGFTLQERHRISRFQEAIEALNAGRDTASSSGVRSHDNSEVSWDIPAFFQERSLCILVAQATVFGQSRVKQVILLVKNLTNLLSHLQDRLALGFVPTSVGEQLQSMGSYLCMWPYRIPASCSHPVITISDNNIPTDVSSQSETKNSCRTYSLLSFHPDVAQSLASLVSSWMSNEMVTQPSARPAELRMLKSFSNSRSVTYVLTQDPKLLEAYLANVMRGFRQGNESFYVVPILSDMLQDYRPTPEDTQSKINHEICIPRLASAFRSLSVADRDLVGACINAVVDQTNWSASEVWQAFGELREIEENHSRASYQNESQFEAAISASYGRLNVMTRCILKGLQLLEFVVVHCSELFDESLPQNDNPVRATQVAEVALHILDRLLFSEVFTTMSNSRIGLADCSFSKAVLCSTGILSALTSLSDANMRRVGNNPVLTTETIAKVSSELSRPDGIFNDVSEQDRIAITELVSRIQDFKLAQQCKGTPTAGNSHRGTKSGTSETYNNGSAQHDSTSAGNDDDENLCSICYADMISVKFVPCEVRARTFSPKKIIDLGPAFLVCFHCFCLPLLKNKRRSTELYFYFYLSYVRKLGL